MVSKTIQIRDIDDDLYSSLVKRAAETGITVPELLRRQAVRLVARPSTTEWLKHLPQEDMGPPDTEVVAALDEMRGPWPDDRA